MENNGPNEGAQTLILELTVKNQYIEIDRVNGEFNTFAEKCRLSDSIRRKVNLVFDELLNNIISYAFQDEEEHHIGIRVEHSVDKLNITISDDGSPFNIFNKPPPQTDLKLEDRPIGGMGIHLVRSVMDDYYYRRENGKNISTLIKNLEVKDPDKKEKS